MPVLLCSHFVPEGLRFVRRHLKETVTTVNNNLVTNCFNVMDSLVAPWVRVEGEPQCLGYNAVLLGAF